MIVVTPELIAKITGAKAPIEKSNRQVENNEHEEILMSVMRRLLSGGSTTEAIFQRPQNHEADPGNTMTLVEMGFPEHRVR